MKLALKDELESGFRNKVWMCVPKARGYIKAFSFHVAVSHTP